MDIIEVLGDLSLECLIKRTNLGRARIVPSRVSLGQEQNRQTCKMFKTVPVFLALVAAAFTSQIASSYVMLEKQAVFKPEFNTEPVETHVMKEVGPEAEHPVYTADVRNQGRARIEPVIKHDAMLADQPAVSTEVNRNDEVGIHANGYIPGTDDVAYPDIPYRWSRYDPS